MFKPVDFGALFLFLWHLERQDSSLSDPAGTNHLEQHQITFMQHHDTVSMQIFNLVPILGSYQHGIRP